MIVNATEMAIAWAVAGANRPTSGLQQRLDRAGECGLADPAQRQGRDRDPELARGDVRIQVSDELARQLGRRAAFRGKLLEPRPARRHQCELRGDEEAVGHDQ